MPGVSDKKPVVAVLAVLAVVVGFVWLANVLTTRGADPAPDPSEQAQATPTEASTPSPSTPAPSPAALPGCTPPPATPTAPKRMNAGPDLETARGKSFVATVSTNCGDITLTLDGTKAPAAVASFLLLARENYWAGSPCHRLTGDAEGLWVLQCGDPTGTGSGPGPGYKFGVENAPADGRYPRGTLAMARTSDPNSNKDQFFLTYKDTTLPTEEGGYTVFGTVTGGMDIVDRIAAAGASPADQSTPLGALSITSVSVREGS